jgi:hypothetical protein
VTPAAAVLCSLAMAMARATSTSTSVSRCLCLRLCLLALLCLVTHAANPAVGPSSSSSSSSSNIFSASSLPRPGYIPNLGNGFIGYDIGCPNADSSSSSGYLFVAGTYSGNVLCGLYICIYECTALHMHCLTALSVCRH